MNESALHELAGGWVWTRLESCIEILDSQRVPINADEREKRIAGKPTSELYPYYGATGKVGWIDDYLFDEELVLLGEDGAPFFEQAKNKAYIIKGKSWVNNHAHVLNAIADVTLNQFLCNYLNVFDYHGYVTGTTRAKLNQSPMRKIPIPLPPLPEQRRIVTKIEELFTRLDAGVSELKKTQAQLKRYRQSVLKAACEGKLVPTEVELAKVEGRDYEPADVLLARINDIRKRNTKGKYIEMPTLDISDLPKIPEGWLWVQAQDVCNWITNGYTPKANKMFQGNGEIPFIKVYNLTNKGELDFSKNPTFISKETHKKELSRSKVFPGDILMNIVGPPLGKVSVVPDIFPEWNINQAIVIYRPLEGFDKKFLCYSLLTDNILSWAIKRSKATAGQFNLTITICRNLPLPLPPLAEQRRIVAEVERRLSVADEVARTVEHSLVQAQRLRQSILKKAFEGRLVAQDANDEPAGVLVERIRQQKQLSNQTNKTTRRKANGNKSR